MNHSKERLPSADSGLVAFVNANARFHGGLDSQAALCVVGSVVIHAFLVLGLRAWRLEYGAFELLEPEPTMMVFLPGGAEAMAAGEPAVAPELPSPLAEPDPSAEAAIPLVAEGAVVTGGDLGSSGDEPGDVIGERLRRGRPLVPALAVPTLAASRRDFGNADPVDTPGPGPEPIEDDAPTLDSDVITVELVDLPESDSLDLGRLTGLRPELAFMTASAWVLIRNQEEVLAYLRRTYRDGILDPAVAGFVSVTLWIDNLGVVEWAEVSQSSGKTELDEVALALFNEVAKFRPARDRGENVSRSVTFSLNFPW